MRLISTSSLQVLAIAVSAAALASCSGEAKKARFSERGDASFRAGDYAKAKIEYLNALRVDGTDTYVLRRIGTIWLEEGAPVRAYPYFVRAKELEPTDLGGRTQLAKTLVALGENARATDEVTAVLEESPGSEEALSVLINAAQSEQDFARAAEFIRKIPEGHDAFYHLASANLAVKQGDFAYAASEAEQAVQLQAASPEAHVAMATVCLFRQDQVKAGQEFEKGAMLSPLRSDARLKWARFQIETNQLDKAESELTELTQRVPDYLSAWSLLAQIAISNQHFDQALKLLENVFREDGANVEATLVQSQVWLRQGATKKAISRLENLANSYSHVPVINYELAQAYLIDNNVDAARTALEDAVNVKPDYTDAVLLLAQTNLQQGQPQAAIAPLSELVRRIPGLVAADVLLVEAYRKLGRLEEATAVYRGEVRLAPESADAHARLGAILREQGKMAEAEAALKDALKIAPDNVLAFEQLVRLYTEKKDFAAAEQLVQQKLTANPKSAVAYLSLGKVSFAQKDWPNAIAAFHKALDADPTLRPAFDFLIDSYLSSNQLDQAISELQGFLSKNPNDLSALRAVGQVYEKLGRYPEARTAYEKVLSLAPDSADVLNNLAYLSVEQFDQPDKACELARKARALQPQEPAVADTLGWALYNNGDYGEAFTVLRESAEKLPASRDAQLHFALASYSMGELEAAGKAFHNVLAIDPASSSKDIERRLSLIEDDNLSVDQLQAQTAQYPDDVVAWTRLGSKWESRNEFAQAAVSYERAIAINPELLSALEKLAELELGPLHSIESAFDYAKRAKDLAPSDPKVSGILGRIVFQLGNFPWSYSLLTESVRRIPDNPVTLKTFGWSAYMLAKISEARRTMQKVLALDPGAKISEEANAFLRMTELDQKPNVLSTSENEIQKVLSMDPNFVPALIANARLQTEKGDTGSAAAIYLRILQKYPDFAFAQKYLAQLYAQDAGRANDAYTLAIKARNALPADGELAITLGELSFNRREYPYAIDCFLEASRHGRLSGKDLYYLGIAQIETGEPRSGQQALANALKDGLDEPMASLARQRLGEHVTQ